VYRSDYVLPDDYIAAVNALGELQLADGSVDAAHVAEAQALATSVMRTSAGLARAFGQDRYGEALLSDFGDWIDAGLNTVPDFSRSRDALQSPADGMPFFFAGPLRLANGGRTGWRLECLLALREEPEDEAYLKLYKMFPHPKNICQSSHLLAGSQGLVNGNNIVFFPENIKASQPLSSQQYAVFFFNKFHKIFNQITLPKVGQTVASLEPNNPTGDDKRKTYLARCVWGYLHDYFHHQGARPFDENVAIKTRWFTGLLEEIKVDLETWLSCKEGNFIDGEAVAEFILLDRAFRYPCEPDWNRNFDSGTGLLLLSLMEQEGGLAIDQDGWIRIDMLAFPAIARRFIAEVRAIEALPDAEYVTEAKRMVRRYLPEGPNQQRIGLPEGLAGSMVRTLVGSASQVLRFSDTELRQSLPETQAA